MIVHTGGCHCGAVQFRIELASDEREVLECNCSVCAKKGILHLIVPEARFALVSGGDALVTYSFGTHVAKHMFCRTCGIHPFYRPRSHPDAWDVNVRCLDDVPLGHWRIRSFDGANWEQSVDSIR
ncbi:MAG: GFA family protein [Kofleriaceae bacterium]